MSKCSRIDREHNLFIDDMAKVDNSEEEEVEDDEDDCAFNMLGATHMLLNVEQISLQIMMNSLPGRAFNGCHTRH
jgi:hypothetical protein